MGLRVAKKGSEKKIIKIKALLESQVFFIFFIILLSGSLLIAKGGSSESIRTGSLADIFQSYTDEGAIPNIINAQAKTFENNPSSSFLGYELTLPYSITTNTLHQTALLAFNSSENDFSNLEEDGKSNAIVTYTVQEGDTISFIASDFGISVNTIIWANNLKNINGIRPGDELKIPPVNGIIYKVKKGDTIESVAKKYSAEKDKIISFNFLPKNGSLQVGEEIIIPDGKISSLDRQDFISPTVKRFAYLPDFGDFFRFPTIGFDWGRIHGRNGVDIANSCGTPIYASADGAATTTQPSGWNGGFGKFIKLIHANGTETVYAHLSKLIVGLGDTISKGQLIALMGSTGRSTGCHLHFEVHGAKNPLASAKSKYIR